MADREILLKLNARADTGAATGALLNLGRAAGQAAEQQRQLQATFDKAIQGGQQRLAAVQLAGKPENVREQVELTLELEDAQRRLNAAVEDERERQTGKSAMQERVEQTLQAEAAQKRFNEALDAERERRGGERKDQGEGRSGVLGAIGGAIGGRFGGLLQSVEGLFSTYDRVKGAFEKIGKKVGGGGATGGGEETDEAAPALKLPKLPSFEGLGKKGGGGATKLGFRGAGGDGADLFDKIGGGGEAGEAAGGIGDVAGVGEAAEGAGALGALAGPLVIVGAAAAAAGLALAAFSAEAWAGVQLASPVTQARYNVAVEDTIAVLGERFVPVMEFAIDVVQDIGDVFQNILPSSSAFQAVMDEIRPALADIKQEFLDMAPALKELFTGAVMGAGAALKVLVEEGIKPATKWLRQMLTDLGFEINKNENPESGRGAAVRDVTVVSLEEVYTQAARAGLMSGNGQEGEPIDAQQLSVMHQMTEKLTAIATDINNIWTLWNNPVQWTAQRLDELSRFFQLHG